MKKRMLNKYSADFGIKNVLSLVPLEVDLYKASPLLWICRD